MYAIAYFLITILNFNLTESKSIAIFSDSLSAIKYLQNISPRNQSTLEIQIYEAYKALTERKYDITLVWIPSHTGIKGNEKADELAKIATNQNCLDEKAYFSQTEIYSQIDSKILAKWQEYNDKIENIKHYKIVEPKVSDQLKFSSRNKKKENLITQLRLGTAYTNEYLHRIHKHPTGHCDHCPLQKETIAHILLECPYYNIKEDLPTADLQTLLTDQTQIEITFTKINESNNTI